MGAVEKHQEMRSNESVEVHDLRGRAQMNERLPRADAHSTPAIVEQIVSEIDGVVQDAAEVSTAQGSGIV